MLENANLSDGMNQKFEELKSKTFDSNTSAAQALVEFHDLAKALGHRGQFNAVVENKRIIEA